MASFHRVYRMEVGLAILVGGLSPSSFAKILDNVDGAVDIVELTNGSRMKVFRLKESKVFWTSDCMLALLIGCVIDFETTKEQS